MTEHIKAAERVFMVLDVLLNFPAAGLSPSEVARAAQISPPAATRSLQTLLRVGWAERVEATGRWRPSVSRLRQIVTATQVDFDNTEARLREDKARIGID